MGCAAVNGPRVRHLLHRLVLPGTVRNVLESTDQEALDRFSGTARLASDLLAVLEDDQSGDGLDPELVGCR